MMLTILRTGFLVDVRVLLFLQSMYLGFWGLALFPRRDTPTQFWASLLGLALLFAFLSLAGIAAAILLRRGRRWAAVTAILIEGLWAAAAVRRASGPSRNGRSTFPSWAC